MKSSLSKLRTKKSRNREKQANKAAVRQLPLLRRPVFGLALGLMLWLLTSAILSLEVLLSHHWSPAAALDLVGQSFILMMVLGGVGLFLQVVQPNILKRNNDLLVLALTTLVAIGGSKLQLYVIFRWFPSLHGAAPFLVPYALAPMLATILLGAEAGLAAGTWTSIVLAMLLGGRIEFLLCGMVTTILSAVTVRRVRARSKVVKRGLAVGLVQTVFILAQVSSQWEYPDLGGILHEAVACLLSGFSSAVLALLILPLFEAGFKIASDISLLEISDMGHPLLQRLAMEAPGTYHHSLVVANLAMAAADAIGANSLLARVCAYYHDIGKLTKPEFFSENQNRGGNPHDALTPSMSTLVITAHVKEGLSLAMRYHLPPCVMAGIVEHHGTCVLSCFHHKARQQLEFELPAENAGTQVRVSESDFRYPGPRPSSRETAILCLADAIEAASRSLEKVTPTHLEALVSDIVKARVMDGQLDACPMSFEELARVRKSLVFSLSSMLHGRVPYPTNESNGNQQTATGSAGPDRNPSTDEKVDGAGRED